jgi:hypothetical protein
MPRSREPEFLNITDCARCFGVSRMTMYGLIKAGEVRAVRYGCRSLVNMASARRFFNSLPSVTTAQSSRTKGAPRTMGPVKADVGK